MHQGTTYALEHWLHESVSLLKFQLQLQLQKRRALLKTPSRPWPDLSRQIASMPVHVQSRRCKWWQSVSAMLVMSDALLITLPGLAQRLHSDWHDELEAFTAPQMAVK